MCNMFSDNMRYELVMSVPPMPTYVHAYEYAHISLIMMMMIKGSNEANNFSVGKMCPY